LAALEEFGLLESGNLDATKKAAIQYVLSATKESTSSAPGFDLVALNKMGLFDSLPLSGTERTNLNTIIALSQGDVDDSLIQSSLFAELGLSSEQASKLAKAFANKSSGGFSIELIKDSGIVDALNLDAE
jgi:hypothetical protein